MTTRNNTHETQVMIETPVASNNTHARFLRDFFAGAVVGRTPSHRFPTEIQIRMPPGDPIVAIYTFARPEDAKAFRVHLEPSLASFEKNVRRGRSAGQKAIRDAIPHLKIDGLPRKPDLDFPPVDNVPEKKTELLKNPSVLIDLDVRLDKAITLVTKDLKRLTVPITDLDVELKWLSTRAGNRVLEPLDLEHQITVLQCLHTRIPALIDLLLSTRNRRQQSLEFPETDPDTISPE